MTLPSHHRWKNRAPYNMPGYFPFLAFGNSNLIGSQALDNSPAQDQHYNTNYTKRFGHDTAISGYADPANQNSTATYSLLNENGNYGYLGRVCARLREYRRETVIVCPGGNSSTRLSVGGGGWWSSRNTADPDDLSTRYGQAVSRAKEFADLIGTPKFCITHFSESDANHGVLDTFWYNAYRDFVSTFRSDTGLSALPFINVGLGPTPPTKGPTSAGGDNSYATWVTIRTLQSGITDDETIPNAVNVNVVDDLSLTATTHIQSDEIHYNSAGYNAVANGIIVALQDLEIL